MQTLMRLLIWTLLIGILALGGLLFSREMIIWQVIVRITTFLFVVYLPGCWISYCFFGDNEISGSERVLMSSAVGLLRCSLLVFYLNYFGIEVYPFYIYLLSLGVIVLIFVYLLVNR